jgi:hypothetical protein
MMSIWSLELEPDVEQWLESLPARPFGTAAFHIDRLAEQGSSLRMPHSRALGDDLFELRFDLDGNAHRVTFFFPGDRRIVLLTTFRKQRLNERAELSRARDALRRCVEQRHTAEGEI